MSNGSEVMIYLSFLLSEFIATRRARLEAREAGFLVNDITSPGSPQEATKNFRAEILTIFLLLFWSKR